MNQDSHSSDVSCRRFYQCSNEQRPPSIVLAEILRFAANVKERRERSSQHNQTATTIDSIYYYSFTSWAAYLQIILKTNMLAASSRLISRTTVLRTTAIRSFATGPASGGEISDELLARLGSLSTQALVDGLWVMGWPSAQIDGARPLSSDMKCVGRAVTLNFVPARPDIAQDKPAGGESPEYEAFEKCGPNEVLVMSSVGPWESVGGDIKFLRLKQLEIGGLVTDGSVRDTDEIIKYVQHLLDARSLC